MYVQASSKLCWQSRADALTALLVYLSLAALVFAAWNIGSSKATGVYGQSPCVPIRASDAERTSF
ncbi:hypothetical protein BV25DRAFT_1821876 [Artomyces pyxidatus]|uniref:Uncharacterized protein n=1 Tax=Artomyces pyxidatus TaxID=48021 RepID=A0ACB8TBC1_9AGAM|nr:hypothetical protein BV25DRAFT_1821876 [Artomyces pyxidatus]